MKETQKQKEKEYKQIGKNIKEAVIDRNKSKRNRKSEKKHKTISKMDRRE